MPFFVSIFVAEKFSVTVLVVRLLWLNKGTAMLEAAIAFAWTVSVHFLFLLHSHRTLQLHAAQRMVDGRVQSSGLEQAPRGRQCPERKCPL